MTLRPLVAGALAAIAAGAVQAQTQAGLTLYGRVDLSLAQQADAPTNREVRNGSGSRLGVRGVEDLGDGLKAFFHLEHRFNADDGLQGTSRFWEGKSIVGFEYGAARVWLGRDENPAYTFGQTPADPWGGDTVASNGSIVAGRIGATRYSSSANARWASNGFSVGAQLAEAAPNVVAGGAANDRPYSLGARYDAGTWSIGLGYENPADADDRWATLNASYAIGAVKLSGLVGRGRNLLGERHEAWLLAATLGTGRGEWRASAGRLRNVDADGDGELDRQLGFGYHHALSKRTTLYADLVRESRDELPDDRRRTGFDLGVKHNF